MKLHVVNPGLLSTIQDRGRSYWRASGVPVGGAADLESAEIAHALLSNPLHATVLEFAGGVFKAIVVEGGLLSFFGNGGQLIINRKLVASGKVYQAEAGDQIEIEPSNHGCYAYLTCTGGWKSMEILGSKSACLSSGFGREVQPGDMLESEQTSSSMFKELNWYVPPTPELTTVRVLAGPEAAHHASVFEKLLSNAYEIGARRNRMGIQLIPTHSQTFPATTFGNMVSAGVFPGIIQIPPDGRPFVLMADGQTTGGYPRMAIVVAADLARFAQVPSGRLINFQLINLKEAETALVAYRKRLNMIRFSVQGVR
ncbi:MAG: biotin-dependent carboxyltransferase family protein [Saprospiraceae bacterium]|nr:biotin-dependent carboxyltransferase family protein [Saprospiraceae bacterium]